MPIQQYQLKNFLEIPVPAAEQKSSEERFTYEATSSWRNTGIRPGVMDVQQHRCRRRQEYQCIEHTVWHAEPGSKRQCDRIQIYEDG